MVPPLTRQTAELYRAEDARQLAHADASRDPFSARRGQRRARVFVAQIIKGLGLTNLQTGFTTPSLRTRVHRQLCCVIAHRSI
jgi:hypothetical protein